MYIRKISRKNADGSVVSYLQLAHNVRDPQKGYTKAEVIYNFGRQEELDVAADLPPVFIPIANDDFPRI